MIRTWKEAKAENVLIRLGFMLWAIWKGRNELLFEGKNLDLVRMAKMGDFLVEECFKVPQASYTALIKDNNHLIQIPIVQSFCFHIAVKLDKIKDLAVVVILCRRESGTLVDGVTVSFSSLSLVVIEVQAASAYLHFAQSLGVVSFDVFCENSFYSSRGPKRR
ncbi:conserved hypothetical protein [Ricinus communis]|uniref:Uncharacterized protein n=1 Tax=Ricinus communis TaxID=3988 RepID=B9S5C0_RICCO|nr:conserved hypothetical protein [Ricinus communis]